MSEGILIIASVVIATSIAGVVMSQVGVFESTFTATTENQKDIILTKVKIVYVTNTTDNHVNVWVKNIGINPIIDANKTDVYYGEINQVQNIPLNTKQQPGVTYHVTVTTPNGVTDEQIFSVLGNP